MPRNVLQTLTIVALVSAIIFVAHNFVRYILRGKYTCTLSLYLCKILNVIWNFLHFLLGTVVIRKGNYKRLSLNNLISEKNHVLH